MIVDLESGAPLPEFSAEICVVGAGAAGIVLAAELVRQGRRVLLLESGGSTIEPAAQQLNECTYTGQPHQGANSGRFRALGGTTTAWGGQILALSEEDFAARPWVPGSGWPFSKSEMEPYYERALRAEGLSGVCRDDEEVWRQLSLFEPDLGNDLKTYYTRWCREPNFARLYREPLASPNLRVVLHATATALLLDEGGSRIRGVTCRTLSGREQIFSAVKYALCLGTIESVRFLLQPQPNFNVLPWNQSGLLGCHFHSHLDVNAARVPAEDAPRLRKWFANAYLHGYKYHPKFKLSSEAQKRQQILSIAGSITCINTEEKDLRRVKALVRNALHRRPSGFELEDLPRAARQLATMLRLGYGYRVRHRAYWPAGSSFWLRVHCEQQPLSASRIALSETRDATGLLGVRLDWRVSPLEWKTISLFTELVEEVFAARGLARIQPQPELAREDGYQGVVLDNSHHHMGGTRMASSPREGVVDTDLRLHGIENVYVCSASVFSSSGFSNPTHTLIALALRLADRLAAQVAAEASPQQASNGSSPDGSAHA